MAHKLLFHIGPRRDIDQGHPGYPAGHAVHDHTGHIATYGQARQGKGLGRGGEHMIRQLVDAHRTRDIGHHLVSGVCRVGALMGPQTLFTKELGVHH